MATRYQTAVVLLCLALLMSTPLGAFSFFGSPELTPEQKIEQLQRQQIDAPLDPEINYNLGVALYRAGRFDEAKTHFARTLAHTRKRSKLATQTFFNKANAGLKNALSILPQQWEKQEVLEPQILDNALANITEAIDDYQSFLAQKPNHANAQANKKYTEGIKKKLEKKQQEQQKKQQEKNQKDQQGKQQDSSREDQKKQDQNNKQQGQQNNPADKKNEERKENNTQQAQQQDMSSSQGNEEKQAAKQETAQAAQQKESPEDRRMRAMLENLQSEESAQQKALMQRQTAAQPHQPERGQKPW
ncbi:MAG: tetratricopeptide repeat protein [Candidatus Babeliales bacterium]